MIINSISVYPLILHIKVQNAICALSEASGLQEQERSPDYTSPTLTKVRRGPGDLKHSRANVVVTGYVLRVTQNQILIPIVLRNRPVH